MRLGFAFIVLLISTNAFAESIAELQVERDVALKECMSHLPARESMAWRESHGRGKFPKNCKHSLRLLNDVRDMAKYRDDLIKMYDTAPIKPATRDIAEQEAEDIAIRMVTTTRTLSKQFNMINSAILNNVLVNTGVKEGGQCYQWVRGLIVELPPKPYQVFERIWGGAYVNRFLENNGVIFTVRGQDLQTGILYDAWRAHGHPWWRFVKKDHYPWLVRFTETDILAGRAQVTGVVEVKNQTP